MKKFLKVLCLVFVFAFGLFGLVACGEEESKDKIEKEAISYNDFYTYITKDGVVSQFIGYKLTRDDDISAEVCNINGEVYAHMFIDMETVVPSLSTPTRVEGDVYLYNDKMYIDNGEEKYFVDYNSYKFNRDTEVIILGTYLDYVLSYADVVEFSSIVETNLKNIVLYQTENNKDVEFEIVYNSSEETLDTKTFMETIYTLSYVDKSISKIVGESNVINVIDSDVEIEKVKLEVEKFDGNIYMPNFSLYSENRI